MYPEKCLWQITDSTFFTDESNLTNEGAIHFSRLFRDVDIRTVPVVVVAVVVVVIVYTYMDWIGKKTIVTIKNLFSEILLHILHNMYIYIFIIIIILLLHVTSRTIVSIVVSY
jgi:hypothetical protein